MWLQCAPVEERMVVSEIGEQWSPNTAPAMTADMQGIISEGSTLTAMAAAIGNMMPNVPQLVPVAKAITPASMNKITGRKPAWILPATKVERYSPVCISLTTVLIIHAKIKDGKAPRIEMMPCQMALG